MEMQKNTLEYIEKNLLDGENDAVFLCFAKKADKETMHHIKHGSLSKMVDMLGSSIEIMFQELREKEGEGVAEAFKNCLHDVIDEAYKKEEKRYEDIQ